jgi:hypothetical protein
MRLYVNCKCMQKAEVPTYQACNVSALQGCRGGRQNLGDAVEADKVKLMPTF